MYLTFWKVTFLIILSQDFCWCFIDHGRHQSNYKLTTTVGVKESTLTSDPTLSNPSCPIFRRKIIEQQQFDLTVVRITRNLLTHRPIVLTSLSFSFYLLLFVFSSGLLFVSCKFRCQEMTSSSGATVAFFSFLRWQLAVIGRRPQGKRLLPPLASEVFSF